MWVLSSCTLLAFVVKPAVFMSSILDISSFYTFVLVLIPFNICMISFMSFFFFSKADFAHKFVLTCFLLTCVGLVFLIKSPLIFLIFLELSVIPISIMINSMSSSDDKYDSLLIMLILNLSGSLPFMAYCSTCLTHMMPSENFGQIIYFNSYLTYFGSIFILLSKVPSSFFHFWLTKAHVAAAGSCSMILASVLLKLGSVGILKFFKTGMTKLNFCWSTMAPLSMVMTILFSLIMMRFLDIKTLAACSSVLHVTLSVPLIYGGSWTGVYSSVLMMVAHGLVSYMIFLLITVIYEGLKSRSSDSSKGFISLDPCISLIIFLFLFLNLGFPPMLNFLSEVMTMMKSVHISLSFSASLFSMCFLSVFFTIEMSSSLMFGQKFSFMNVKSSSNILLISTCTMLLMLISFLYI